MKKISRHQWIKAKKEYMKLSHLKNLSSEEKKLLKKYEDMFLNYETIDYELDLMESKIDRIVFFSPLTILIPIYALYGNFGLGTNSIVLDFFTIFFITVLFIIFTNLFQWTSFVCALIFLPWLMFYFLSAELIEKFAKKILKDDILEKIIEFGSSYRLWFHNKLIKIYKY